ncbi:MAG: hypothetical protein QS2022_1340 [Candidatus Phytoplasma asteris]|uniref:Uncharacterized protein n=1 Tax='Chrysanthemum coronarium' phytoplasma TaxID=1520703 RepID=A0ABQ0J3A2_9MOLU|nr:hypothetical protein ['Chrysanthemum coronarium' phytoplasma]TKA88158.1 MAG: hypothetical protein PLY_1320 [Periwinkle leaf yellowing phytoplasma]WEX19418.1 MAG: hypothetical protein QS2022_1340 [Candidatus Phytoplasma asteris]GAK74075.1 putative uncharacterized protein ['Chrysanthemum coronarium' phytoplasma]
MAKKTNKNTKNNKSNKIIIKRKTQFPKIIIETQTQKENWLFKIIKTFFNILIWYIPLLLIGGAIYWTLFKFFPEVSNQINTFTANAAAKTKVFYDKATQPIRQVIEYIYNKLTGNDKDPNHIPSPQNKLGYYLATTLSVIGICLGFGKIGNWLKNGKKKTIKKRTKTIIQKKATSKIANVGGKILKIGSKVLFWVSLASTAYELYQFYQEETKTPNPPQQLTHKMENPSTPILQASTIQQSFNPTIIENEESTLTNNNEVKEETTQEESKNGNLNNPC